MLSLCMFVRPHCDTLQQYDGLSGALPYGRNDISSDSFLSQYQATGLVILSQLRTAASFLRTSNRATPAHRKLSARTRYNEGKRMHRVKETKKSICLPSCNAFHVHTDSSCPCSPPYCNPTSPCLIFLLTDSRHFMSFQPTFFHLKKRKETSRSRRVYERVN